MNGPIEYKQYKLWFESESHGAAFPGEASESGQSAVGRAYIQVWGLDNRAVLELDYEVTLEAARQVWGREDAEEVAVEEGRKMAQEIIETVHPRAKDDFVPHLKCRIESA